MTGKELIIYIVEHNLMDKDIFKEDSVFSFLNVECLTVEEAALRYHVGYETIHAWCTLGKFQSILVNDKIYILINKGE